MTNDTKLSDLTVGEFKALMRECLRSHEKDLQFAKWNGLYPDDLRAQHNQPPVSDRYRGLGQALNSRESQIGALASSPQKEPGRDE